MDTNEPDQGGARRSAGPWLALVATLSALHFGSFFDADAAVRTDTRYYVWFARVIAEGGVPHLDYFDNKTQAASVAGALLHRLGALLGVEPLSAIRAGYLGLVALGGVLGFLLLRRLSGGRSAPAFLAFLPYLGFTYIGTLPAVGNVPKVIVAVAASGALLASMHRRWALAGAIAAFAPLDWQIGVLAPIAVTLAAALDRDRRRAVPAVLLGGGAVALATLAYLLATGSLGAFWEQTVGSAFARGEGPFAAVEILERRLRSTCAGHLWLVTLGLAGLAYLPLWAARRPAAGRRPARVALLVHHGGVVAFSLRDFQGSGDTMLLLHSLALFAGLVLLELHDAAVRRLAGPGGRRILIVIAALVLLVAVRPVIGRRPGITTHDAPEGTTLADQRRFREALQPWIEGRRVLLLGPSELLYFEPFPTETPFVYWNAAAAHVFLRARGGQELPNEVALERLIGEVAPEVLLTKLFFALPPSLPYAPLNAPELERAGPYRIRVYERSPTEPENE